MIIQMDAATPIVMSKTLLALSSMTYGTADEDFRQQCESIKPGQQITHDRRIIVKSYSCSCLLIMSRDDSSRYRKVQIPCKQCDPNLRYLASYILGYDATIVVAATHEGMLHYAHRDGSVVTDGTVIMYETSHSADECAICDDIYRVGTFPNYITNCAFQYDSLPPMGSFASKPRVIGDI